MDNSDEELLGRFTRCFGAFDDMVALSQELDPIAWELRTGKPGRIGVKWKPRKVETSPRALKSIYEKLPAKFPPLLEALLLGYRWAEVDLGSFRLLANPPGPGLEPFKEKLFDDDFLVNFALSNGYLRFGKGPDVNYDPVCFDIRRNPGSREFPVVRLDHEAILCNEEIEVVEELAPNFRSLIIRAIEEAHKENS